MADIPQPAVEAKQQLALGRQPFASDCSARARKHFLKAIQLRPADAQLTLALGQSFFF
jgi:Flp pilus assembly protein TadD